MGNSDGTVEEKKIYDLSWMNGKVPYVSKNNRLYQFCCFFLGKRIDKLNFKELYLILYGINKRRLGEDAAKKKALNQILLEYKNLHHNKLPKGIE